MSWPTAAFGRLAFDASCRWSKQNTDLSGCTGTQKWPESVAQRLRVACTYHFLSTERLSGVKTQVWRPVQQNLAVARNPSQIFEQPEERLHAAGSAGRVLGTVGVTGTAPEDGGLPVLRRPADSVRSSSTRHLDDHGGLRGRAHSGRQRAALVSRVSRKRPRAWLRVRVCRVPDRRCWRECQRATKPRKQVFSSWPAPFSRRGPSAGPGKGTGPNKGLAGAVAEERALAARETSCCVGRA